MNSQKRLKLDVDHKEMSSQRIEKIQKLQQSRPDLNIYISKIDSLFEKIEKINNDESEKFLIEKIGNLEYLAASDSNSNEYFLNTENSGEIRKTYEFPQNARTNNQVAIWDQSASSNPSIIDDFSSEMLFNVDERFRDEKRLEKIQPDGTTREIREYQETDRNGHFGGPTPISYEHMSVQQFFNQEPVGQQSWFQIQQNTPTPEGCGQRPLIREISPQRACQTHRGPIPDNFKMTNDLRFDSLLDISSESKDEPLEHHSSTGAKVTPRQRRTAAEEARAAQDQRSPQLMTERYPTFYGFDQMVPEPVRHRHTKAARTFRSSKESDAGIIKTYRSMTDQRSNSNIQSQNPGTANSEAQNTTFRAYQHENRVVPYKDGDQKHPAAAEACASSKLKHSFGPIKENEETQSIDSIQFQISEGILKRQASNTSLNSQRNPRSGLKTGRGQNTTKTSHGRTSQVQKSDIDLQDHQQSMLIISQAFNIDQTVTQSKLQHYNNGGFDQSLPKTDRGSVNSNGQQQQQQMDNLKQHQTPLREYLDDHTLSTNQDQHLESSSEQIEDVDSLSAGSPVAQDANQLKTSEQALEFRYKQQQRRAQMIESKKNKASDLKYDCQPEDPGHVADAENHVSQGHPAQSAAQTQNSIGHFKAAPVIQNAPRAVEKNFGGGKYQDQSNGAPSCNQLSIKDGGDSLNISFKGTLTQIQEPYNAGYRPLTSRAHSGQNSQMISGTQNIQKLLHILKEINTTQTDLDQLSFSSHHLQPILLDEYPENMRNFEISQILTLLSAQTTQQRSLIKEYAKAKYDQSIKDEELKLQTSKSQEFKEAFNQYQQFKQQLQDAIGKLSQKYEDEAVNSANLQHTIKALEEGLCMNEDVINGLREENAAMKADVEQHQVRTETLEEELRNHRDKAAQYTNVLEAQSRQLQHLQQTSESKEEHSAELKAMNDQLQRRMTQMKLECDQIIQYEAQQSISNQNSLLKTLGDGLKKDAYACGLEADCKSIQLEINLFKENGVDGSDRCDQFRTSTIKRSYKYKSRHSKRRSKSSSIGKDGIYKEPDAFRPEHQGHHELQQQAQYTQYSDQLQQQISIIQSNEEILRMQKSQHQQTIEEYETMITSINKEYDQKVHEVQELQQQLDQVTIEKESISNISKQVESKLQEELTTTSQRLSLQVDQLQEQIDLGLSQELEYQSQLASAKLQNYQLRQKLQEDELSYQQQLQELEFQKSQNIAQFLNDFRDMIPDVFCHYMTKMNQPNRNGMQYSDLANAQSHLINTVYSDSQVDGAGQFDQVCQSHNQGEGQQEQQPSNPFAGDLDYNPSLSNLHQMHHVGQQYEQVNQTTAAAYADSNGFAPLASTLPANFTQRTFEKASHLQPHQDATLNKTLQNAPSAPALQQSSQHESDKESVQINAKYIRQHAIESAAISHPGSAGGTDHQRSKYQMAQHQRSDRTFKQANDLNSVNNSQSCSQAKIEFDIVQNFETEQPKEDLKYIRPRGEYAVEGRSGNLDKMQHGLPPKIPENAARKTSQVLQMNQNNNEHRGNQKQQRQETKRSSPERRELSQSSQQGKRTDIVAEQLPSSDAFKSNYRSTFLRPGNHDREMPQSTTDGHRKPQQHHDVQANGQQEPAYMIDGHNSQQYPSDRLHDDTRRRRHEEGARADVMDLIMDSIQESDRHHYNTFQNDRKPPRQMHQDMDGLTPRTVTLAQQQQRVMIQSPGEDQSHQQLPYATRSLSHDNHMQSNQQVASPQASGTSNKSTSPISQDIINSYELMKRKMMERHHKIKTVQRLSEAKEGKALPPNLLQINKVVQKSGSKAKTYRSVGPKNTQGGLGTEGLCWEGKQAVEQVENGQMPGSAKNQGAYGEAVKLSPARKPRLPKTSREHHLSKHHDRSERPATARQARQPATAFTSRQHLPRLPHSKPSLAQQATSTKDHVEEAAVDADDDLNRDLKQFNKQGSCGNILLMTNLLKGRSIINS